MEPDGKMNKTRPVIQGERKEIKDMSNVQLNYVSSPVTHKRDSRDIRYGVDNTTTKCGITLPTRILKSTVKPSNCPICEKKGQN
jgi:hypothetical protein